LLLLLLLPVLDPKSTPDSLQYCQVAAAAVTSLPHDIDSLWFNRGSCRAEGTDSERTFAATGDDSMALGRWT